jgi:hypothetical protein
MTLQERLRELAEKWEKQADQFAASIESGSQGEAQGLWRAAEELEALLAELPTDTTP